MIWDNETTQTLRTLWDQGHSTAEIGRRMGFSQNSIVGKAHRLDLTERPSPIRRGPAQTLLPDPVGRVTLPPLASAVPELFATTTRIVARINIPTGRMPTTTSEDERWIRTLRANGLGYGTISKRTGFSESIVRRVVGWTKPSRAVVRPVAAEIEAPVIVFVPPVAGQCLWLNGSRPYVQCTEMALAGEGVARPWSYCVAHRNVCFVPRRRECAA